MSKLPVWSDLLNEALPASVESELDNPGPFTVSERDKIAEANTVNGPVVVSPGDKVQVPVAGKVVPGTIKQISKASPSANNSRYAVVATPKGTANVPAQFLAMSESDDQEMMSAQLDALATRSSALHDLLRHIKLPDVPAWIQTKIANAEKDINAIFDYMKFEDTGPALDRISNGGPGGTVGAGNREVQSEHVNRILEALTYDVSSEETDPETDTATEKPTKVPVDKKEKSGPSVEEPEPKSAKPEPKKDEPSDTFVLYRYNPTLGWSPHFINPAKDGALESPVYSTPEDAKAAYRRNVSQSPKTISFRIRKVPAQQGMKIHAKFEEMGKILGYDTIKEEVTNADPVVARMQVKAAAAIAHALSQGQSKQTGESPSDVINAALRVWAKLEQTPETLHTAAEMLRTANRMGIKWDKKIVGPKLKDYLGEAGDIMPTAPAGPPVQARSMTTAANSLGNTPLVGAVPQSAPTRPTNQQQSTTSGRKTVAPNQQQSTTLGKVTERKKRYVK